MTKSLAGVLIGLIVVLLASALFAAGDDPKRQPAPTDSTPPRSFASIDELSKWAKSSAFGGGSISEPYKLGAHTVYVVDRMHTSGMLSAELSVYTLNDDGKGATLALFQPARYMGISTRLVDDAIVCESKDPETGKVATAMTISRQLFEFRALPAK